MAEREFSRVGMTSPPDATRVLVVDVDFGKQRGRMTMTDRKALSGRAEQELYYETRTGCGSNKVSTCDDLIPSWKSLEENGVGCGMSYW